MTSPKVTCADAPMVAMFIFTGGAVVLLLGSLVAAELRDLARARRKARRA
jgi:hypothetical protein